MLRLEPRETRPVWLLLVTPLMAVLLTLLLGGVVFTLIGIKPLEAMRVYFVYPLADLYGVGELFVKATPLMLCALGLMFCFRAGIWNIGAEGQLTIGALLGSTVALQFPDMPAWLLIPAMVSAGALGGILWAMIPALFKTRFNANEILTTLMLVYVAQLLLSALVHGPLRDPHGFNFPQSARFGDTALIPIILADTRLHAGFLFAMLAMAVGLVMHFSHRLGFAVRLMGQAPLAAIHGGFSSSRITWGVLLLSGALAGIAGLLEVAGPIGRLSSNVSPGYGFTAIIVAFLGRLHPVGIVLASMLLALSYLGGELAQILLKVPNAVTGVFQGILLLFLLASDVVVRYRIRWMPARVTAKVN